MKLYRVIADGPNVIAIGPEGNRLYVGEIHPEDRVSPFLKGSYSTSFEHCGDLPDMNRPHTMREVEAYCERWIQYLLNDNLVQQIERLAQVLKPVIINLRSAIKGMPDAPAPPKEQLVNYLSKKVWMEVASELKRYRDWASSSSHEPPTVHDTPISFESEFHELKDGIDLINNRVMWRKLSLTCPRTYLIIISELCKARIEGKSRCTEQELIKRNPDLQGVRIRDAREAKNIAQQLKDLIKSPPKNNTRLGFELLSPIEFLVPLKNT